LGLRNAPVTPPDTAGPIPPRPAGGAGFKNTPGRRIMAAGRVKGSLTAPLLRDTGADRTMISPRTLQAAGVAITRPVATGNITGATGTDRINYVFVDSLEVGEARVGRMPVGSYELAGTGDGDD